VLELFSSKPILGLIIGIDNYYLIVLKDEKITVRTHCIQCGFQIEVKSKIYQGKDFTELLKMDQVHSNDPYTLVHLLCKKCDMMRGFQDEVDRENTLARERIRNFFDKPKKKIN
jgi:hypothetical protein